MDIVEGVVKQFDECGLWVFVPASQLNLDHAFMHGWNTAVVGLNDGRTISHEQRKKAHALISEIADWMGEVPQYVKRLMKLEFIASRINALERQIFSLSDCDVSTAREFISYLIDFILRFDIPTQVPLYELCDDIEKYIYATLMNKKCAVCGRKGELHHVDRLGMGSDRRETPQIGMKCICLCREHHNEVHNHGDKELFDAHHLIAIPLTEDIGKAHKLTKKALREA